MGNTSQRRDVAVSMRFRGEDLAVIDRGADLNHLSRSDFVRRAALQEAQMAILNQSVVQFSAEDFARFVKAVDGPARPMPATMRHRLKRAAPWNAARGQ